MRRPQTLAFRMVATGLGFLLVALGSIGLSLWVTWQLEGGAAAVNEAGRMRMLTYRMALQASRGELAEQRQQAEAMDAALALLRDGDPSRPLFIPADEATRAELAAVTQRWLALREAWFGSGPAADSRDRVEAMVQQVDRFVGVIERRLSRWTSLLSAFQLTMAALAVFSAVLLLYTNHLMVLEPLRRLGQALAAIRQGDFGTRVQIPSSQEFNELADGFNAMATRLQSQYGQLEDKVREKTAGLEAQRERLAALYEVSAFVAKADTLDELARGFAGKIRRIARADGVALRWSDAAQRRYLMLAQDGLPPGFAAEEQCLPSGDCHCGNVTPTAQTRVVAIRRNDGDSLGHCSRAGFSTLVTVPLRLHQQVLGEIDLFFRGNRRMPADDRSLVELLANHLAGGMEGLRAAAADKEAAVAGERGLIAQELHDSIAQSLVFLKIQVELLRNALKRADQAAVASTVGEIEAGVLESYGDVRELLMHFRTRTSNEDIEPALRTTLQKFEHQTGLASELVIEGHGIPLPPDVQVQVLHVVQEALSNVRKHARASGVRLRVTRGPQWRFEVSDDGIGFDATASAGESHVGQRIMRERAARIGATLGLQSAPGSGTRVSITVPQPSSDSAQTSENLNEHADTTVGG